MIITIIYTVFILLLGLFTDMKNDRSRKWYLIISSIILILISGLRSYYLGSGDTSRYANMFAEYSSMTYREIYETVWKDPIYHIFSVFLSKILGANFLYVLIVFGAIFMFCYDKLVYRKSPNLLISFIIFFSMGFFNFSMHGVRQGLAIAFIMLSYFPLKDKKLIPFLIYVAIAACFHKTALIFAVAYPFCQMEFNKKTLLLYIAFIAIMFFVGNDILREFTAEFSSYDERLNYYSQTSKALNMSGFIQLLLFVILILTNFKSYIAKDKDSTVLLTLLILALTFQTFAIFIAEMFRVAMYFSIFLVILIPRFLSLYSEKNRKIITVVLCVLLLFYFYSVPAKLEYDFYWND